MTENNLLARLVGEWAEEAFSLMNWWSNRMVDPIYGGFRGLIHPDGKVEDKADKGLILNTRILWGFSYAARFFEVPNYIVMAERAYTYLQKYFLDKEKGGLFWMLDYKGEMLSGKKQIYGQAFGIYALSEYFLLTGDPHAKKMALDLFGLIEKYSLDTEYGGYWEAFDQNWGPLDDLRLGTNDANEPKTMNTHLHILEAYTNLYRIESSKEVEKALENLLLLFVDKFWNQKNGHLHLFFDNDWSLKSDGISYGHDIEASWLMWEAAEVLGKEELMNKLKPLLLRMAKVSLEEGLAPEGPVANEFSPKEGRDTDRIWWVQVEAMVGFMNAIQLSGDPIFLKPIENIWAYVRNNLIDQVDGEWYWGKNEEGVLMEGKEKAGPWKAPYHAVRALIECVSRAEKLMDA